jgi:PII-like signaling protein
MMGYQVTFFSQQGRRIANRLVHDWLMDICRALGIAGVTTVAGVEGVGRGGKVHSAHFFELADQPLEITMALTQEQCTALFARLQQENADLFYVKTAVEFGVLGAPRPA